MSNTIVFAIVAFQTLVHFLVTGQTIRERVALWVATKAAGKQFIQVHRNYVVNMCLVKKLHLSDNDIELLSGNRIPMSRRFKEKFMEHYPILR